MSSETTLNVLKQGISRIREKGGADPSTLFDLVNGYVTIDGSANARTGTRQDVFLPAGTKGLMAFNGAFIVFSNVVTPIADSRYECEVLIDKEDATQAIKEIYFASPFLGWPYVVAEFANGDVYHFWLQGGKPWQADTTYMPGDLVTPTVPNGFVYSPTTQHNPDAWQPSNAYVVGDVVQPTVYNGYKYTLIEVDGDNPTSGTVEPTWLATDGALVYEDIDGTPPAAPPPKPPVGGGGSPGGSRYGSDPGCVTLDSWVQSVGTDVQARSLRVGDRLELADYATLEPGTGMVEVAQPERRECVRVVCANGVTLDCSTTAPIATRSDGYVLAPNLAGLDVATRIDGRTAYSQVISARAIGEQWVMSLTVGNRAFWAGQSRYRYMLHHNMKRRASDGGALGGNYDV